MKKALIIIDMQIMPLVWKDYGGKTLYEEEKLIENTKYLIDKARKRNTAIYYIMYTEPEGSPRAQNQPLWQVLDKLVPAAQDYVVIKHHADSFLETELHTLLQDNEIDTLVMCGVQTEYCVDTTVKSAYSHGYKVELVRDCHSTYNSDVLTAEQMMLD